MHVLKLLRRQVSGERFDLRFVQWTCYGMAFAILVMAIRYLTSMELTEFQLLIGALSIFQFCFMIVLIGSFAEYAAKRNGSS